MFARLISADDSDSQGPTPSSTSGISCSSNATVIDLREPELEEKPATVNSIPDHISHGPPANSTEFSSPAWKPSHVQEQGVYAHLYSGLETKTWQRSLCRASHASNAKTHFVYAHKDHELAILELQRRQHRAERFMVAPSAEAKRPPAAKGSEQDEKPTKRQKTWWKAPVSQGQITRHIARWLIRDGACSVYSYVQCFTVVCSNSCVRLGLAHNLVTTEAFHDFLVGVTGDINVIIPSSKTYNDILDKHYDTFTKDTSDAFAEEFQELDETPFMTVEHDLWTNSSKNSIVGVSGSYINRHWRPVRLALLAEVKMMVMIPKEWLR